MSTERENAPDDMPSIGVILRAEKDNLEVEFSLKSKTNPIGVAEYQLNRTLPRRTQRQVSESPTASDGSYGDHSGYGSPATPAASRPALKGP